MVDNFQLLRPLIENGLSKNNENFYQIIIVSRKKDNTTTTTDTTITTTNIPNKLYEKYFIKTIEEYDNLIDILKYECKKNSARCYLKINYRNESKISEELVKYTIEQHFNKNYHLLRKAYTHIVGITNCAGKDTLYHIDIDSDDLVNIQLVHDFLKELEKERKMKSGPIITVPTVSGLHLLTQPFDTELFKKRFPTICISKDTETLLYY